MDNKTIMVFRYDNFHPARGEKDLVKEKIEAKMFRIFSACRIPLTVSVIPNTGIEGNDASCTFPISDDCKKIEFLKKLVSDGNEIALNGYHHLDLSQGDKKCTEFYHTPYEQQLWKMKKGKRILENCVGTKVRTFVPPWARYDSWTIKSMEEAGLAVLSPSNFGEHFDSRMKILPCTCGFSSIKKALEKAEKIPGIKFVVARAHYHSFFEAKASRFANTSIDGLKKILELSKKSAQIFTIRDAVEEYGKELTSSRFEENARHFKLSLQNSELLFFGGLANTYFTTNIYYPEAFCRKRNKMLKALPPYV